MLLLLHYVGTDCYEIYETMLSVDDTYENIKSKVNYLFCTETAITFSDDCVHAEKHYKMSTGFKSIRKAHTKNVLTPERSSTPLSSDEEIAMSKFPAKPAARPPPQGSLGQRDPHTPIQMRERISVTPRPANQPSPIGFPLTQKACVYDAV
ncbi:hypothetical protein GQR58_013381 [Nymphon striatum]|nr:hypothetical protein GQR58_013381 [Nymphon striatum]